jgi:hypothetical protein
MIWLMKRLLIPIVQIEGLLLTADRHFEQAGFVALLKKQ